MKAKKIEKKANKQFEAEIIEYADSIINTVREPLLVLDHDLRVVKVSRSFYDFFREKPTDTVGKLVYDLGNKQWNIPKLQELLETILPQKTNFENYEFEHEFASIGKRVMLLNARQIQQVLGKKRIILLAIEDITDRKRMEEVLQTTQTELEFRVQERTAELAKANEILQADIVERIQAKKELQILSLRNQAMLEAIPDIIMEVDVNKVYTWANRSGIEFFGADVLGKEATFFFEDEQDVYSKVQPLFNGGENIIYLESWQRRRDGEKRLLAWWCRVLKDASGNVSGALSTAHDITEIHRIEETLRENELRFKAQYQGIPIPTFTWKKQGEDFELIDFNNAAKVVSHEKVIESIGRKAGDLYANRLDILLDMQRCFTERKVISKETLSEHFIPGKLMIMTIVFIPPDLVMVHMEDITERKRLEKEKENILQVLRAKNEELERFTYSVSHDLKSPLVTIRTFLGHLAKDMAAQDNEKIKEDIDYIGNGAEKMSRLLDELLNLSRIGRKPNPPEDISLQSLVQEASALVAGRLTEHNVEVNITKTELILHGDRTRLIEVFQNLLDNACKFMGTQKSPLIKIGVETNDDETVIFVRDNGVGIDPQFLPKLFNIFEKLDRGSEGDGIGLALVKRIVEVHGGRIWVESAGLGQGTTFKLTLAKSVRDSTHYPPTLGG